MLKRNNESGLTLLGIIGWFLVVAFVLVVVGAWLGGMAIEYVVEFWASYAKGKPVDVPIFPCTVAGVFFGWNLAIPVALITWVLSFAL